MEKNKRNIGSLIAQLIIFGITFLLLIIVKIVVYESFSDYTLYINCDTLFTFAIALAGLGVLRYGGSGEKRHSWLTVMTGIGVLVSVVLYGISFCGTMKKIPPGLAEAINETMDCPIAIQVASSKELNILLCAAFICCFVLMVIESVVIWKDDKRNIADKHKLDCHSEI